MQTEAILQSTRMKGEIQRKDDALIQQSLHTGNFIYTHDL